MSQQIDINVLKPHPRNNDFFDDLNGEEIMNNLLDGYKNISKEYYEIKKIMEDLKNDQKHEIEIKKQKSDILTCGDVCKKIACELFVD